MTAKTDRAAALSGAKRLVVKVGTGVLTVGDRLDLRVIIRLADQISLLREDGLEIIIISSGAVGAGARKLNLGDRPEHLPWLQAAAAVGQSLIMQEYESAFSRYEQAVAQILLTRDDLAHRRRYLNARNTLFQLLEWRVIPIINENDTVAVDELRFGDNDNLSAMIASMVGADLYINLTRVEGFYSANPLKDPRAEVIPEVDELTAELEAMADKDPSAWGLGGMYSKIQAAYKVALCGIPAVIASGKRENVLRDILAGKEIGTFFRPQRRVSVRKHWIAFTLESKGAVVVDEGAAEAVIKRGKSLLPSGVVQVQGRFAKGAQVRVAKVDGEVIAVGLTNYSSGDINKIKGLNTRDIEAKLGYKDYDEIIHRDNMFVPGEEEAALCHLLS